MPSFARLTIEDPLPYPQTCQQHLKTCTITNSTATPGLHRARSCSAIHQRFISTYPKNSTAARSSAATRVAIDGSDRTAALRLLPYTSVPKRCEPKKSAKILANHDRCSAFCRRGWLWQNRCGIFSRLPSHCCRGASCVVGTSKRVAGQQATWCRQRWAGKQLESLC